MRLKSYDSRAAEEISGFGCFFVEYRKEIMVGTQTDNKTLKVKKDGPEGRYHTLYYLFNKKEDSHE